MQTPTVQVHVIGTCNLECLHCYSRSGPAVRERLRADVLSRLFRDAVRHGYRKVALSGGEPLLHPQLPSIVRSAEEAGLAVCLVTNGTLFDRPTWKLASPHIRLVAVSVDGPEELHNHLRRSATAFERMTRGLVHLKQSGVPFGFIHTVTRDSVPHLEWLGEFAASHGARLLQLHPLGLVGSGHSLDPLHPDGEVMARAYVGALMLQNRYLDQFRVQVDVFNREVVRRRPELIYAHPHCGTASGSLSDLVNPLVVMSNGDLSPICHAMPPGLRLGNLSEAPLDALAEAWREQGYARLRSHCRSTWEALKPTLDWPYFNWYEILERAPFRDAAAVSAERPSMPAIQALCPR